jgi:O-antigen/teichoic acid export membrane protein
MTSSGAIAAVFAFKHYFKLPLVSKEKTRALIRYSWPLLGLNVFAFFSRSLDRIFLAGMTSMSMVGVFSVAATLASIFGTLLSGFFFALGPHILSTFRESESPKRYARMFNIVSCAGLIGIVGIGLWGGPIVTLLKPEGAYQNVGIYIPWIICGILLYHLGGYFTPGPDIAKKTHWKFFGFVFTGVANAALNYLLIPFMGILGAVFATTASSLMGATFNIMVSARFYAIPFRWILNFAAILLYAAIVSLMQSSYLLNAVNLNAMVIRAVLTPILILIAMGIYIRDIKTLRTIKRIWEK